MTAGFDPATPNTARVYSRLLGGKDHFPADRAEADLLLEIYPPLAAMVRENRAFLAEAVPWAASEGIGQFLDLGAGLPTTPAVHQTVRAILPTARVAYVDRDPMVLSHARALLAGPRVAAVAADLRDPAAVLTDLELRAVIDPAEPVCVILGAVLHFLDADTAREVTAGYARLITPGSCLVISCATYDDEALAKRLTTEYTAGQFVNHTRAEVASFLAGLDLVGPGITEAQTWRPWMPDPVMRHREGQVLVGVARRQARPPARQPVESAVVWHSQEGGKPARHEPSGGVRSPGSSSIPGVVLDALASRTTIFGAGHRTDVEYGSWAAQVLAVSGKSIPVTGAAERHALRHAGAGDLGDAAHRIR